MRKNLVRLIQKMNMFSFVVTEESPEYKYLDPILSDEEVDLMNNLRVRKPVTIEALQKKSKVPMADVKRITDRLLKIGILEYKWDENGTEMINMPLFAPGHMESFLMVYDQAEEHPEASHAFCDYVLDLQEKYAQFFPNGMGLARVIPVEKAIQNEPRRMKLEELSYWVDKYYPSISVAVCQCRRARRIMGTGSGDPEDEWCIELGQYAESCIKTGRARRITDMK